MPAFPLAAAPTRRHVARGALWSIPALAIGASAPWAAASATCASISSVTVTCGGTANTVTFAFTSSQVATNLKIAASWSGQLAGPDSATFDTTATSAGGGSWTNVSTGTHFFVLTLPAVNSVKSSLYTFELTIDTLTCSSTQKSVSYKNNGHYTC